MMLSHDLRVLHDRFDDWISGRIKFEVPDAFDFRRRLSLAAARAALIELGVDTEVIQAVAACEPSPVNAPNVIAFPRSRIRRVAIQADGGAA